VRSGQIGARELVGHALEQIEALDPAVNAFVTVDADAALAAADDIDQRVVRGDEVGPLAGLPIGVKDLEDAAGLPTSYGSAAWAGGKPAREDSVMVSRLRAAGCVVVGKTNTPELGWKPDTDNPAFGATHNPWDLERSPGGSSGGSAAAIAAGMVPLATGSDGGGSIRIPAAMCAISGMKPSLGRVPVGGNRPGWSHLSVKAPMARSIRDVTVALDAVIGPHATDLRSLPLPESSWTGGLEDPDVPVQVAWSPSLGYATVDAQVLDVCHRAVDVLADLGADVTEVEIVFSEDPVATWITLSASYLRRTIEPLRGTEAWDRLDPGMRAVAEWAESLSGLEVIRAEDECHLLNLRLVRLFRGARLLVTPTTAATAPLSGGFPTVNGVTEPNWVKFTYPFNLTASPAASVCAGFTDEGLPVGLQLVGPQHGDLVVLRAAAALEDALGLDTVAPLQWRATR
jgi:Asp-tRNA(Asn)/Glu-tRNA(Gln) amidotransferase A subunit family amidase